MASLGQLVARLQPAEWVRLLGGPILESELRVASRRARTYVLRFLCAGVLFAIAFFGWLIAVASWYLTPVGRAETMAEFGLGTTMFILWFLVIAMTATGVAAATGIAAEKEAGTWAPLVGTALSDREIIHGKAVGAMARCLPFWIVPALHLLVCTIMGLVHPAALVQLGVLATGLIVFITALGLACSVYCRKTSSAVIATLAFGAVLWLVVPISNGVGMIGALYLHPVSQAVQVMEATTGSFVPWTLAGPKYGLCAFIPSVPSVLVATFFIGVTAAIHVFAGMGLLKVAMARVRRGL